MKDYVQEFIPNNPSSTWIKNNVNIANTTIICDDRAHEANEDILNIFNVLVHHNEINFIYITQSLFWKNKYSRDISLGSNYIVLFKNPRDKMDIANFAKQYAPGSNKLIRDIYTEATEKPYSYLMFDLRQETPKHLRLLSNYFYENGSPPTVYLTDNTTI
jgi:hypothetical protein